jgi:riboflavin synthase alpha subunit
VTTLGARAAGARVNLEVDLIAKYVERLLVSDRSPR